jgi:hypothetical protein
MLGSHALIGVQLQQWADITSTTLAALENGGLTVHPTYRSEHS